MRELVKSERLRLERSSATNRVRGGGGGVQHVAFLTSCCLETGPLAEESPIVAAASIDSHIQMTGHGGLRTFELHSIIIQ